MIDTAEKRLSMLDFGSEVNVGIPFPSGAVTANERFHLTWLYSGFGAGPPGGGIVEYIMFARHRGRR